MSSRRNTPAAMLGLPMDDDAFQEACLSECLADPIAFQEFFFPDPDESRPDQIPINAYDCYHPENHCRIYPSQMPPLLWNVGVFPCGRGVGKTELFQCKANVRRAICFSAASFGMAAQLQSHVEPLLRRVLSCIQEHPLLSCFWDRNQIEDNGSRIYFRNGSYIFFRFPGKQGRGEERARGFQGERATGATFDECQNLNYTHYHTASNWQLVSPDVPEVQRTRGAVKQMFGVPDGKRDTPLYDSDVGKSNQEFVRDPKFFPVPFRVRLSWHLPSAGVGYHTREVHRSWQTRHGVDLESKTFPQQYMQDDWGLHGKPSHGLFPRELREPVSKYNKFWKSVIMLAEEFTGPTAAAGGFDANGKIIKPCYSALDGTLPGRLEGPYAFGMDVGKSADSVIGAWRMVGGKWRWEWMLTLRGYWPDMEYQSYIIDYLIERYDPIFFGIDQSTLGMGVVSPLQTNPLHPHDYRAILKGFDSSGHYQFESAEELVDEWMAKENRVLSESERAMQLISAQKQAKKQPFHLWTVNRISILMQRKDIELPDEAQAPEIHKELEEVTMTRTQGLDGKVRYELRPQHPHIVDSIKQFVGGLRLWETENRLRVRTVSDSAVAAAHRQLMFGGGMGLG